MHNIFIPQVDNAWNAPDEPLKNAEDYVLMNDPLEEFQVASEFPVLPRWIKSEIYFIPLVNDFKLILCYCTERQIKVCTWWREISSWSCLTVLPGPAWVLLSKTCKPLFAPLYAICKH